MAGSSARDTASSPAIGAAARQGAEQAVLARKELEAGLELAFGLVELPGPERQVAEPEMEPRDLLARHAVAPARRVTRLAEEPSRFLGPAAKLGPASQSWRDAQVALITGQHSELPPGLVVASELELGLGHEAARRDRGRVRREQPPGSLERLGEAVLSQEARGQHARRFLVPPSAQRERMAGGLLGAHEVLVVGCFTGALEIKSRELGEVPRAPRVARDAGAVELDVEIANPRPGGHRWCRRPYPAGRTGGGRDSDGAGKG